MQNDTPTTAGILLDLVKNGARMGPIVNARMTAAAFFGMPYGIAFAGAQGCIQAVQSGKDVLLANKPLCFRHLVDTRPAVRRQL